MRLHVFLTSGFGLFLLFVSCTVPRTDTGRVVFVRDGDTVDVKSADGTMRTVRLFGVDCPEYGQSFGKEATAFVESKCAQQMVTVEVVELDRYGRTVGIITLSDGSVLNKEIIAAGMGWWYEKFAPQRTDFAVLERRARENRLGLWVQNSPQPPWTYRQAKRNARDGSK